MLLDLADLTKVTSHGGTTIDFVAGMTQSDIADRTGIPQPTISKVVRGEVSDVMSRNYRKLQELHAVVIGATDAPAIEAKAV